MIVDFEVIRARCKASMKLLNSNKPLCYHSIKRALMDIPVLLDALDAETKDAKVVADKALYMATERDKCRDRAEKAEKKYAELKKLWDMYGGEEGIVGAIKQAESLRKK